jgi:uncharacterized protein with von Willebrand factor type A (vWA) domain
MNIEGLWKFLESITKIIPLVDTYLELQIKKLPLKEEFVREKFSKKIVKQKKAKVRAKFRLRSKEERVKKRMKKRGWQQKSSEEGERLTPTPGALPVVEDGSLYMLRKKLNFITLQN